MVRDPDAFDAERHRLLGIGRMHDAFHRHRALPGVAIARNFFPGERAAHALARIADDLVGVLALGIMRNRREARIAVAQQRHEPARPDHHLVDHARARMELTGEAGISFARARRAHWHVQRQRQHLGVDGLRAAHQIETDFVIVLPETIELQPEHVGRGGGGFLDREPAGDAQRVGHTGALGCFRHQQIGAGPDQRRPAHRRHADRR